MNFLTLFIILRRKNLKCLISSSLEQCISNWRLNSSIFSTFTQSGTGSSWRLWGTILRSLDLRAASFKDLIYWTNIQKLIVVHCSVEAVGYVASKYNVQLQNKGAHSLDLCSVYYFNQLLLLPLFKLFSFIVDLSKMNFLTLFFIFRRKSGCSKLLSFRFCSGAGGPWTTLTFKI